MKGGISYDTICYFTINVDIVGGVSCYGREYDRSGWCCCIWRCYSMYCIYSAINEIPIKKKIK